MFPCILSMFKQHAAVTRLGNLIQFQIIHDYNRDDVAAYNATLQASRNHVETLIRSRIPPLQLPPLQPGDTFQFLN